MNDIRVTGDRFTAWSDAGYPRPQLCRPSWLVLDGPWQFAADPEEVGVAMGWHRTDHSFRDEIQVPFPPGSELSGISSEGATDVVWYRRVVSAEELAGLGPGEVLLLHFEAVDFRADVWVDGHHAASHTGGFTPFSVELERPAGPITLVVRAEDRRADLSQPRGKQDWRETTHGIWYERSTGIWRDVWLEAVPRTAVRELVWTSDLDAALVRCELVFSSWLDRGAEVEVELSLAGEVLGRTTASVHGQSAEVTVHLPALANRMEWPELVWAPEHPTLLDATVELRARGEADTVVSYLGLRSVHTDERYLRLNDRPVYIRAVLDQGYWPQSFLTAPDHAALRTDLQLSKDLGFNTVRIHQRVPDRRFLTWADRIGIMVWAEFPAAFEFSRRAVERTVSEWMSAVRRDLSHPSIVVWVPFNESWGVPAVAGDLRQQALVDGVVALTRSLDPTRPVIANDGWEQLDTDLVTLHDYAATGQELEVAYRDDLAVGETVHGNGPQGRRTILRDRWAADKPVIVSEFGGISLRAKEDAAWGYSVATDPEDLGRRLRELFEALRASTTLSGYCYTQLTDTGQETNGLCFADRTPKLPVDQLRDIVMGDGAEFAGQRRPRTIRETPARKD
ncbi:MAG TPA: glycoside hydrolase family 2 TIM barrel-domain containing protein [Actinomycetaceae bacterium]|nr:glycoside hydrolase family 2 TIM barrel-domain containing protein [Actinomycetaceae bacterium]